MNTSAGCTLKSSLLGRVFRVLALAALALICAPSQAAYVGGLAVDGSGRLWISDYDTGSISLFDPATGKIVSTITPFADIYSGTPFANNRIRDLAWDGSRIWAAYWTDPMLVVSNPQDINEPPSRIYALNPASGEIISSFTAPFVGNPNGIAWDGNSLWVGEEQGVVWPNDTPTIRFGAIYKVDPGTGQVLDSFATANTYTGDGPRGLGWDGTDLWVAFQSSDQIKRIDVNGNVLASFDVPVSWATQSVDFDGTYLWATSGITNLIAQIDPTTGEVLRTYDWCSAFPGGGNTGGCFPGPGPFPAPEPGTLALLGLGLAGLAFTRRRRYH